jgi:PST family polysaccharide transporter
LARLLTPHDYGLLAMVTTIIGVAEIFRDFGLSSAAVQAKSLSTQQRDNLFWINTGLGLALSVLVFFSAPLLAAIYGQLDLVPIAQALAWMFLVNGMATQYRADLSRRLQFFRLAAADVLSPLIALAVAVTIALQGGGYWSLVAQQLTQFGVMFAIVVGCAGWLPGRPSRGTSMDGMLIFGWNLVATQLVGYVSKNADALVIGIRFGASQLGLYNRAFQLLMTPLNQVRAPSTTVALPVLSRLQEDKERYSRFLERGQVALGYTLVAGLAGVAGAGTPVTLLFLGSRWQDAAPVLSLLAAAGAFQTLAYVGYWVYVSQGLTKYLFRYSVMEAAVTITLIVGGSQWGIVGVAAAYAVAQAINWPLSLWWLSRWADIPIRHLYFAALRITFVSLVICVSARWVSDLVQEPVAAVLAACAAGGLVLLVGSVLSKHVRQDLSSVLDIGKRALRKEKAIN